MINKLSLLGFIGLFWLEKIVLENPYDVSKHERFEVSDKIMEELGEIEGESYLMFLLGFVFAVMAISIIYYKGATKKRHRKKTRSSFRHVCLNPRHMHVNMARLRLSSEKYILDKTLNIKQF